MKGYYTAHAWWQSEGCSAVRIVLSLKQHIFLTVFSSQTGSFHITRSKDRRCVKLNFSSLKFVRQILRNVGIFFLLSLNLNMRADRVNILAFFMEEARRKRLAVSNTV